MGPDITKSTKAKNKKRKSSKSQGEVSGTPSKRVRETKASKAPKCKCRVISPNECDDCAKIARKIDKIYGKRLALSQYEISTKAPEGETDSSRLLVLADEPCDCADVNPSECAICSRFQIKMGAFFKIYSEENDDSSLDSDSELTVCRCVYLSATDCDSCQNIINSLERKHKKLVYRKIKTDINTPTTSNLVTGLQDQPISSRATTATSTSSSSLLQSVMQTQVVAVDCEMVGVIDHTQINAKGRPKMISALARCSITDTHGNIVLDIYVKPEKPIADYRTRYSGIRPTHMKNAVPTQEARTKIIRTLVGKIVVGHSICNDFKAIGYKHPAKTTRDIVKCRRLRDKYLRKTKLSGPGLKAIGLAKLSAVLLNSTIQQGSHCSVEDARHTMMLYQMVQSDWEKALTSTDPDTLKRELIQDDEEDDITNEYLKDAYWLHQ